MSDRLSIRFSPSKIISVGGRAQRGYRAYISRLGEDRFDGIVDYEVRVCALDLSGVRTVFGQWNVQRGVVDVAGDIRVAPAIYHTRVKPAGAPSWRYSAFDTLLVDDRPTFDASLSYGTQTIASPPPGAFMIFENKSAGGRLLGYTRVDVETDPGTLGKTLRFTKTSKEAFWSPGEDWNLRWYLGQKDSPYGRLSVATGAHIYRTPWTDLGSGFVNVTHPGNALQQPDLQGLLGGFGDHPERRQLDVYQQATDMWWFYALLPPFNRVPSGLNQAPRSLVDLAFGRTNPSIDIDLWHMAVMAPSRPEAALRMRYGESGAQIHSTRVDLGWSVIEDWDWRSDGLIQRIVQWKDVPTLGWRKGYPGLDAAHLSTQMELVDWQLPRSDALRLQLWDARRGKADQALDLDFGAAYQLIVQYADGRRYSGFLEMEIDALMVNGVWQGLPPRSRGLWRDSGGRPIYVSDGFVTVDGRAHGNPRNWGVRLSARPYLMNSSLNGLYPTRDEELIPNASIAGFSNPITLTIATNDGPT